MIDINSAKFDYFETDQIKYAVQLWKVVTSTRGTGFDVLKFTQNWGYAETVLVDLLTGTDQAVSDCALEIMQLRLLFIQRHPERARKMGAKVADMEAGQAAPPKPSPAQSAATAKDPPTEPDPANARYLKSLR